MIKRFYFFVLVIFISINTFAQEGITLPFGDIQTQYPKDNNDISTPLGSIYYPKEDGVISTPLGKIYYSKDNPIEYYASGNIKSIYPKKDFTFNTKYGKFTVCNSKLTFYESYKVYSFFLKNNQTISCQKGILNLAKDKAQFLHINGTFYLANISKGEQILAPEPIGYCTTCNNSKIIFYDSEEIYEISPSKSFLINFNENSYSTTKNYPINFSKENKINSFYVDNSILNNYSKERSFFTTDLFSIFLEDWSNQIIHFTIYQDNGILLTCNNIKVSVPLTKLKENYVDFIYYSPNKKSIAYKIKDNNNLFISKKNNEKLNTKTYYQAFENIKNFDISATSFKISLFLTDSNGNIKSYLSSYNSEYFKKNYFIENCDFMMLSRDNTYDYLTYKTLPN